MNVLHYGQVAKRCKERPRANWQKLFRRGSIIDVFRNLRLKLAVDVCHLEKPRGLTRRTRPLTSTDCEGNGDFHRLLSGVCFLGPLLSVY